MKRITAVAAVALGAGGIGVLAAETPGASAAVDVSTGPQGLLIASRSDAPTTVRIGATETDRISSRPPREGTDYVVSGSCRGIERSSLFPCVRQRPGRVLCLEADGIFVFCPRTSAPGAAVPGVRVRFRDGDDRLSFPSSSEDPREPSPLLGDRFRVDAGGGDDDIRADRGGIFLGRETATGPWRASLGRGDDRYSGSLGNDVVNGGPGDDQILGDGPDVTRNQGRGGSDRIIAGSGDDVVDPGPGRDAVNLGSGRDRVTAGVGREPDSYDGGPGFDRISYERRTRGITVGVAFSSAGEPGEGDRVRRFERVDGGRGPDRILGFRVGAGGPGDDVITGGNSGRFILVGGPGADVLRGFDGDDIINARDGERDERIECGAGVDRVLLDLLDPEPEGQGCERVERRAPR